MIAGDINGDLPTRYVADEFWLMPHLDDTSAEEMLAECRVRGITAIDPPF